MGVGLAKIRTWLYWDEGIEEVRTCVKGMRRNKAASKVMSMHQDKSKKSVVGFAHSSYEDKY